MNCTYHPEVPSSAFCQFCGKPLCKDCVRNVGGSVFCEACLAERLRGGGVGAPAPVFTGKPHPMLAALLGFIPGVGAMYNGQFMKAFVHVGIFVMLIVATDHFGLFGIMIGFWVWYMAFDAYKTAQARQLGLPLPDPLGIDKMFGLHEGQSSPGGTATPIANVATQPGMAGSGMAGSGTAGAPGVPVYPVQAAPPAPPHESSPAGAVILIVLGVFFLLGTSGWLRTEHTWPLILIGIGVWMAYKRSTQQR
jgi:TM2 domain-containing membrane protein YozV